MSGVRVLTNVAPLFDHEVAAIGVPFIALLTTTALPGTSSPCIDH